MPQLKTQKDNLTESEKERFQNAYISELKKLYPVPLPKDGVILNVHSIYRSPYQGDIESYIEVYGDNHEKLMRLTNHAMGCTVQELEHSKQLITWHSKIKIRWTNHFYTESPWF